MRSSNQRLLRTFSGFAAGGSAAWLVWGGMYTLIAFFGNGAEFPLLIGLGLTSPLAFGLALGICAAVLLISAVILNVIRHLDKQNIQSSSQAPQSSKQIDDTQMGLIVGFGLMTMLWLIGTLSVAFASAGLSAAAVGFPIFFFGIPTLMLITGGINHLYKIFKDSSPSSAASSAVADDKAAMQPLSPADAVGIGSAIVAATHRRPSQDTAAPLDATDVTMQPAAYSSS